MSNPDGRSFAPARAFRHTFSVSFSTAYTPSYSRCGSANVKSMTFGVVDGSAVNVAISTPPYSILFFVTTHRGDPPPTGSPDFPPASTETSFQQACSSAGAFASA